MDIKVWHKMERSKHILQVFPFVVSKKLWQGRGREEGEGTFAPHLPLPLPVFQPLPLPYCSFFLSPFLLPKGYFPETNWNTCNAG